MAITLGDNFSYQGAKPLDGRLKYDTVAAMAAMADSILYDGCLAYCVATDKTYQWKSTNTIDASLGRWREYTVTVDSALSDSSTNPVQNRVIKGALDLKADLEDGKIPAAQLPAYVDDVLEYEDLAHFPATGESGKIYIAQDTNKTYRWSGTGYAEISESLALGETSSTAYRGDRGKTAYDISQTVGDVANLTTTEKSSVVGAVNEVKGAIPEAMTASDLEDVKDAFSGMNQGAPLRMMVYSPNEQVVGKWQQLVDGVLKEKPLYQKTIVDVLPTTTTDGEFAFSYVNLNVSIENGWVEKGFYVSQTLGYSNPIPLTYGNKGCYAGVYPYNNIAHPNELLLGNSSENWSGLDACVTIAYTKTTDTWKTVS